MKRKNHSRRQVMGTLLGATTATLMPPAFAQEADSLGEMEIVDTHTHFFDPTRPQGVPWPQPGTQLYRKVMPSDWKALANPLGIYQTVVVEASKWVEDNQWILELAEREKSIVGFVGNLDPGTPEFGDQLKRFAANPVFRGIRVGGSRLIKGVEEPEFVAGIKRLVDRDLSLDVNGGPDLLMAVDKLAVKVPELRIVVDHVGGAGDAAKPSSAWKEGIKASARHPKVWCKVSAGGRARWREGKCTQRRRILCPGAGHGLACLWRGPTRIWQQLAGQRSRGTL
ncbi:amidohydrolase family protein [Verrucomicrobium spinosum]|uniref:amidohydrolase family protein n=1 Tax=Verrucomicrobium spinosum TaxID=2736 RepID=UPI0009E8BC4C|nr:amidohydrolase family protein [Verrucomicrobium spinosum]